MAKHPRPSPRKAARDKPARGKVARSKVARSKAARGKAGRDGSAGERPPGEAEATARKSDGGKSGGGKSGGGKPGGGRSAQERSAQSEPTRVGSAEDAVRVAEGMDGGVVAAAAEAESAGVRAQDPSAGRAAAGKAAAGRRRAGKIPKTPPPDIPLPEPTRGGRKPGKRARGRPAQTFLVAATVAAEDGTTGLRVYAAMTRTPAEALAAVREHLGPDVPVGLTGKLSGRMARGLRLKPGDVSRI